MESFVIGADNQVRGANLRTVSKTFRQTKMTRPLQKIIPLEVIRDESDPPQPVVHERPRRACAGEGEARRRAMKQV